MGRGEGTKLHLRQFVERECIVGWGRGRGDLYIKKSITTYEIKRESGCC